MKTIHLLRHAHTPLTGTYVGSTDTPLSSQGKLQAEKIAAESELQAASHILCSPMLRAKQSAEALKNPNIEICEQLREIDFGKWEGLSFDQVTATFPKEFEAWCQDPNSFSFPEGESLQHFQSRVGKLRHIIESHRAKKLIIVSHGGVLRHLLCLLLGIDYSHNYSFQLDVGHYGTLHFYEPDNYIIQQWNRGEQWPK